MSCSMEIPSLGSIVGFGDIYDAKLNKFTGFNAFKRTLQENDIVKVQNAATSHEYSYAKKLHDKLKVLDIHGEVELSALCGILDLKGSAKYVKCDENSRNITQCSSIQQIKTVKEKINLMLENYKDIINFDGIKKLDGTHI